VGIREAHTHPGGKVCYRVSDRHEQRLTEAGIFIVNGQELLAAFQGYTGSWYAFDPKTGKQIATFRRDFFTKFIAPFRIGDLVKDPDCVPV
jgi:hypothetical protein